MSFLHPPAKPLVRSKRLPQKIGVVLALALLLVVNHSCTRRQESLKQTTEKRPEVSSPFPTPTGLVNDYANLFDPESKKRLETLLAELKQKADIEFAVVTIDTTGGQPIFDYSLALARTWKIGRKDSSRGGGLLLMLALKERQWRLQVSQGLESDLPDDVCKEMGDQSTDLYKQGQYAAGLEKYVNAIIQRLQKLKGFALSRHV
jgi:uncharacterized protein